jgi:hypothetical protein
MQMKRIWRFIKWAVGGFGWFEWSLFFSAACTGFGTTNPEYRSIAFGIAAAIFAFWMFKFVIVDMGRMAWTRFKEEDEKAFNILKDKNIK